MCIRDRSITQFFDCDQEPECSPNDVHTLGGGGESVDGASCASIAESANNSAKTQVAPPLKTEGEKTAFSKPSLSDLRARTAARNSSVGNRVGDVVTDSQTLSDIDEELARSQAGDRSGLNDSLDMF